MEDLGDKTYFMTILEKKIFNICILSFAVFLAFAIAVNALPKVKDYELIISIISFFLFAGVFFPGMYFWIKNIKFYLKKENSRGNNIILLIVFTIPYAIYLEYKNDKIKRDMHSSKS